MVKGSIHQPPELRDGTTFYAFSYYFDLRRGRWPHRKMAEGATPMVSRPFLCLDLTYITCLLREGFGFKDSTVLQLTKKVNNAEASWSLGAMLDHFYDLKIH
ncbi:hypothetical protein CRUP_003631 [Coryphaenoides rupestris]|nr:hypothetical protein CRUP_003631 [Coryphaenoides rupestris]